MGEFPWASFVFMLVLAGLAEACTVRLRSGIELSASFLAFFLGGAIAGPLAAFGIAVGSQVFLFRRDNRERYIWFCASTGIVAGGTSLLYWGILSTLGGPEGAGLLFTTLVGVGIGVFYPIFNMLVVAPVAWFRRGINMKTLWLEGEKPFLPFHMFFLAISLGIIAVYHIYAPTAGGPASFKSTLLVMLCLLPVLGLIFAFRAYGRQSELAKRNSRLATRNARLALQAVVSLIYALDLKDNYTAQHSAAVAQWAGDIAKAMDLDRHEVNVTHMASLLHDVGKIGVSEQLLRSPDRLNSENWAEVESHCHHGYKILRQIDQFDEPATVVLHHHERFDGTGYPYGLSGERIPLASRIISVADAYSAMISDRPYGPPLPAEVAQAELEFRKGTQFDPEVVDCFLRMLERSDPSYVVGEKADFRLEVQAVKFLSDLPAEGPDESGDELPAPPTVERRQRRTDRVAESPAAATADGAALAAASVAAETGGNGGSNRDGPGATISEAESALDTVPSAREARRRADTRRSAAIGAGMGVKTHHRMAPADGAAHGEALEDAERGAARAGDAAPGGADPAGHAGDAVKVVQAAEAAADKVRHHAGDTMVGRRGRRGSGGQGLPV